MKLLFENWRSFREEALQESVGDKIKGVFKGVYDAAIDEIFMDIWNHATNRACVWWGPCNKKNITTNHKYDDHFDAHKHILAAAMFAQKYTAEPARAAGIYRELYQSSGSTAKMDMMDIKNNDIGISIGVKYSDFDAKALDSYIYRIIKKGEFYGKQDILKKDERK